MIAASLKLTSEVLDEISRNGTVQQFQNLSRNLDNANKKIQKRKGDVYKVLKEYFPKYRAGV